jgi:hypothetical protein
VSANPSLDVAAIKSKVIAELPRVCSDTGRADDVERLERENAELRKALAECEAKLRK